jgi:hypothetical protein
VASPEAESNTKLPDNTRAWRVFDFEFESIKFLGLRLANQRNLNGDNSVIDKRGA